MAKNQLRPRRADLELLWEVARHEGIPMSEQFRRMLDGWLAENPGWAGRAAELRSLYDRNPASTGMGKRSGIV